MQNQQNNFEILIVYAESMLGCSFEGLKRKYIRYPISLTVNIDNKVLEKFIQIRFDKHEVTISLDFDPKEKCKSAYLYFDSKSDENDFIEYMKKSYEFDYKKNYWQLYDCFFKIREYMDSHFLYFYK